MSVIIKVFARSVPAIALVLGFLLMLSGRDEAGWILVILGFILQVMWLFTRRR